MITKNAIYGETKDVVVAEFGTGDIHMTGSNKDINGGVHLGFRTVKGENPINVSFSIEEKSFDELKPEIIFIFNKSESIDSVINMLVDCKKEMVSVSEQTEP